MQSHVLLPSVYFVEPFREPVPWKEMGLTDYPLLIKNPMDLGTVLQRLKSRKYYKNVYQAADDVRLVWSNCSMYIVLWIFRTIGLRLASLVMYNADGSDFFKLADTLQRRFDDKYSKLLQDVGVVNTAEAGKVSLQDKRNMAKLMYQVSKEDLGRILVEVEQKCPAAIKRNATEDELELNVDAITGPVLKELTAQLQE